MRSLTVQTFGEFEGCQWGHYTLCGWNQIGLECAKIQYQPILDI